MLKKKIYSLILVALLSTIPSISHANKIVWDIFTGIVGEVTGSFISDLMTGGGSDISALEGKIEYLQSNIQSYSGENHPNYQNISLLINDMNRNLFKLNSNIRLIEKRMFAMELNLRVINARLNINMGSYGVRRQDIEIHDKNSSSTYKPAFKKKLNMLVFNASSSSSAHARFSSEIKSEFPTLALSKQLNWVDKFVMEHTLIFYQGSSNRKYAEELAAWLPGRQVIRDYIKNPGGFFGFNKNRDLIVFVGQDYPKILSYLKVKG